MFDVFVSYRHSDAAEVTSLVQALRAEGLDVWVDESGIADFASIQHGIEAGLDQSKVLVAWYSARYPESLACQWELTRAFVAGQAEGDSRRRVLIVNPEVSNAHIHPIELRDALYVAAPHDAAARSTAAASVAAHVHTLTTTFAQIRTLEKPAWFGAASGQGSNRFVGRLRELWEIHSGLHAPDVPIIRSGEARAIVWLSGMGGSGKSLTAETYALRFGAAYPGGVFWLKAFGHDAQEAPLPDRRREVLEDHILGFCAQLGLKTERLTPAQIRTQLGNALSHRGTYLWVVDDLSSGMSWADAQQWLAPSPAGRTLVTTRGVPFGWTGTHVALEGLDDASALTLLTRLRAPADDSEAAEARALIRDLGSLALAVELAAVLVHRRGFAAVRASIAAPGRDVLDLAASLLATQGEQLPHRERANLSLSATLSLSIDAVPEAGKDLLRLAALLAPAPIPRSLIVAAFAAADAGSTMDAEDAADLALAQAAAESLVREPTPNDALVHSLVARTMRLRDSAETRWQRLREGAVVAVDSLLDEAVGDIRAHGRIALIAMHARALLAAALDDAGKLDALEGRVLDGLYVYDAARGHYREARRIADRLIANAIAVLGPEHRYTLMFMSYVATLLLEQGNLQGALAEHERIYEVRRRTLGPDHSDTLNSLAALGLVLYKQGELVHARAMQEHVLARSADLFGAQDLSTIAAMHDLAMTWSDLGAVEDAIALQEQVVASRRAQLGPNHAYTLASLDNLAVMQRAAGRLDTSQATQAEISSQQPSALSNDHPQALTILNNQAALLYSRGDLPGARLAAERCLRGRRTVLGVDHPDTLATQNNLAAILVAQQDHAVAELELADLLERCRRVLGPKHPHTFQAAFHLVLTLVRAGGPAERVRTVLAQDLAPLMAQDPETLGPELRSIREGLLRLPPASRITPTS